MRFVPVKSDEQQAILRLHRVRQELIGERTALINQLRGLLSEFGLIMPKGRYSAQHHIPDILEDAENGLPMLARRLLNDTWLRLQALNEQILAYDRELNHLVRDSEPAKRLMTIPGIGAITATAMLAAVGDPKQFGTVASSLPGWGSRRDSTPPAARFGSEGSSKKVMPTSERC